MKRRDLVTGFLAATAALSFPRGLQSAVLAGEDEVQFLSITRRTIEVNGKPASVFGLAGPDGKPGLRVREGQAFKVLLRNASAEHTIIHWHGLTPPWPQDGVPDAPSPLIAAGEVKSYDFPVGKGGTHWMHAHTLQEQALLAAPLIVSPARPADEQDVVMLLHDFSFRSAEELLSDLSGGSPAGPMAGMDHGAHGNMSNGSMIMDLNDIEYDAYLANDRTLEDPEVVDVDRGGRVRLRIINGATATAFTIDLGEIEGELVAVDGQDVAAIKGRRFPMSMGQRIDIRLALPKEARSFPILALREGAPQRTGVILRARGAEVAKVASEGSESGPVLDLQLESRLRAVTPLSPRIATRSYDMTLTGDMASYKWGLALDTPILVAEGDRAGIKLTNTSMMAHPMHLHGHHFQVIAVDGQSLAGAVRDTVLVPPRRSVTIAVDAGNPGQWAFHCHHLYHMATGMMTTFGYQT